MNYLGISIIVVRNGKIRGTKTHLIKQALYSSFDEVYQSAIFNFYEHQLDIPKKFCVLTNWKIKKFLKICLKESIKKSKDYSFSKQVH